MYVFNIYSKLEAFIDLSLHTEPLWLSGYGLACNHLPLNTNRLNPIWDLKIFICEVKLA